MSATPFNVVTSASQIPADNEVVWRDDEDEPADGNTDRYYGQAQFTHADMHGTFEPGSINGTTKDPGNFNKRVNQLVVRSAQLPRIFTTPDSWYCGYSGF